MQLYTHVSCVALGAAAIEAVCMHGAHVKRWAPSAEDIDALVAALAFAYDDVELEMIDDTSDGVSTLFVSGEHNWRSFLFSINVMGSGFEGRDADAAGRFAQVLGRVMGVDLGLFSRVRA
ncbi:MAG: hypothetical protein AAF938_01220 [Myxococcota bacterium]